MEQLPSQYKRVIGGKTEERRQNILDKLKSLKNERVIEQYDDISPYELKPTKEDLEIMIFVEKEVDTLIRNWGGDPTTLPKNKIYLVQEDSIIKITEGKLMGGYHGSTPQHIVVERSGDDLEFALTVGHEMFHLKSYKAAQILENDDSTSYRGGVGQHDRKNPNMEYFGDLEEAIVEESTWYLRKKFSEEGPLQNEIKNIEMIKTWIRKILIDRNAFSDDVEHEINEIASITNTGEIVKTLLEDTYSEAYKEAYIEAFLQHHYQEQQITLRPRGYERQKLNALFDDIILKSGGVYKNREELFEIFAKANYSGNLFEIARLLEKTLGRGSFREIAESFARLHGPI